MAFNFEEFGTTPETTLKDKTSEGFSFESFGNNVPVQNQIQNPVQQNKQQDVLPTFPYTGKETPITAGAKSLGNLPTSIYRLGKGVVDIVKNPIETIKGIKDVAVGGVEKLIPGDQQREQTFNAFTKALQDRYGSLDALQKTAIEDPFGFGSDVLSILGGGATLVGRGAEATNLASNVARRVTQPVAKIASGGSDLVRSTARFGVSQSTGLNPETITQIIKNPQALKSVNPELRVQTAQAVADVLDTRLEELGGLGKGYEAIRNSATPVQVPPTTIPKVLSKYGVQLDEGGKIITTTESRPLSGVDRASLQEFIDNYGTQTNLTSNSFLNVREALSNLSKFEQGKTSLPQQIARDLRAEYDAIGKTQIPNLKALDNAYAPERQLLSQLKKDIIDSRTGELKDSAISKIANLTGKGKEQVLERVKQIVPDIEERVNLIKTVEDIERASGLKTGTYIRGAITGGGVLTGNIPLIISSIVSQPQIAVPLLKGFGYTGQKARPILEALKDIANDVNNFKIPAPLLNKDGKIKAGLSIEDVSKKKVVGKTDLTTSISKAKASGQSFDEWVKGQGDSFYHTTPKQFDKFDKKFLGENTNFDNATHGFFFTDNLAQIEEFKDVLQKGFGGGFATNARVKTPAEIAKYRTIEKIAKKEDFFNFNYNAKDLTPKEARVFADFADKKMGGLYNIDGDIVNHKKMTDSQLNKFLKEEVFVEDLDPDSSFLPVFTEYHLGDFIKYLESKGYTGLVSDFAKGKNEYMIFDPNKLKTRSQLKAEWDKVKTSVKKQ